VVGHHERLVQLGQQSTVVLAVLDVEGRFSGPAEELEQTVANSRFDGHLVEVARHHLDDRCGSRIRVSLMQHRHIEMLQRMRDGALIVA
jgi:hypothetical protein